MNIVFLFLFIELSLSYNLKAAIAYARKYCSNYNTIYNNQSMYGGNESANFVSQCLVAGGLDFKECVGKKDKGMIVSVSDLRACLDKKGWKKSVGVPKQFIGGYPFFQGNMHAMIATEVKGTIVTFCGHQNDRCEHNLNQPSYIYYYL